MSTFTTNLKLGGPAFVVQGGLDPYISRLTVGQIRVVETLPSARNWAADKCYVEECMCLETGVGGGNVWEYGTNVFSNEADAQAALVKFQQIAHKERAERDARRAEAEAWQRRQDLEKLRQLKEKYEVTHV